MLDDDVSAAAAGDALDLFRVIARVVVEHVLGAECARAIHLVRRRCREHARAGHARELDGRLADAAPAREHEDRVVLAHARARHEHVPRGEKGERERSRGDEVYVCRKRDQILDWDRNHFGVTTIGLETEDVVPDAVIVTPRSAWRALAAADAGLQHHFRAWRDRCVADRRHFTGDIASRDVRQGQRHALDATPLPQVQVIQRTRAHVNNRASGGRLRIRRILVSEDIGVTMLVEANCLHDSTLMPGLKTRPTARAQGAGSEDPAYGVSHGPA